MKPCEFYVAFNKYDMHCEPIEVSTFRFAGLSADREQILVREVKPDTVTITRGELDRGISTIIKGDRQIFTDEVWRALTSTIKSPGGES